MAATRRPAWLALAAASLAFVAAPVGAADAVAAAAPREFLVDLPLQLDGRAIGELGVVVGGAAVVAVDERSFAAVVARHLSARTVQELSSRAVGGRIPIQAFADARLALHYDPVRLLLTMEPQREQRALESLSLQQRSADSAARAAGEADFSAYANLRALHDIASPVEDGGSATATRLALDGAARVFGPRGAALEWSALYNGDNERRWRRGELRAVHDDVASAVRYSLGDVRFQATAFQGTVPLLGLSAERRFGDLQPLRAVSSTGQQSFVVARPSLVVVYINGLLLRTFQLPPGRYNLADFTAATGANDVRVEIEDTTGRREVIEFTLFGDVSLLGAGESEFSANAGWRRRNDASSAISYDFGRPAVSGFFRYGWTGTVTAGASLQGEKGLAVAGADVLAATPMGNLSGALSSSHSADFGQGHSGQLRWSVDLRDPATRRLRNLDLSAFYTGANYRPLGIDIPDNRFSWQYQARFATPLPFDVLANLSAGHARSRSSTAVDESRITLLLTRRFGHAAVTLGAERTIAREDASRFYLNVSIPLDRYQRILASTQSGNKRTRVEWFHAPTEVVGNVSGRLGVETSELGHGAVADAAYTGNRFIAGLQQELVQTRLEKSRTQRRTRLQLETAVATAGGHVAVGRPIGDAFAIVSRHPTLKNAKIDVNASDEGPLAVADAAGPALVPRLGSYREQEIAWSAQELPDGYDLGDTRRRSIPSYRAGLHFQAGSAASITAMGIALLPDGKPVSLSTADLQALEAPGQPVTRIFTNRSGRFVAQSLAPGAYLLTFPGPRPLTLSFTIARDAEGFVDLGTVRLKEK